MYIANISIIYIYTYTDVGRSHHFPNQESQSLLCSLWDLRGTLQIQTNPYMSLYVYEFMYA
jgi:hypothetical protein